MYVGIYVGNIRCQFNQSKLSYTGRYNQHDKGNTIKYLFLQRKPSPMTQAAGCERCEGYLEVSQGVAVALVTSVSHGTGVVRHRHSKCLGDGSLWESRTLCHYSDICGHKEATCCRCACSLAEQGHRLLD